jgi:hypothetical protein
MGFMDKLFPGRRPAPGQTGTPTRPPALGAGEDPSMLEPSQFPHSQRPQSQFSPSQSATGTPHAARKDLLRMVLRETLTRNGIPTRWIGAEVLRATLRDREPGVHLRFLIREWDPRLLEHGPALEENYRKRLLALDPESPKWLMGISWQFALADAARCPALPHPGWWTAEPHAAVEPAAVKPAASGDVIEGPVHIGASKARVDLDKLLAENDAEAQRGRATARSFAATQPIKLR